MSEAKSATGDMNVAGNLIIADGSRLRGNLRCERHARIGKDAVVEGDVSVGGTLSVRAGARISGRVTAGGDADWEIGARADALHCQGELRVGGRAIARSVEAREGVAAYEEEAP